MRGSIKFEFRSALICGAAKGGKPAAPHCWVLHWSESRVDWATPATAILPVPYRPKEKHPPRNPLWLCLMQSTMATLVCKWQGAIKLLLRPADSSPSNPSGSPTCLLPGSGHLGALIHHAVSTFLENKRWAKRAISLARIGHEVVGQKQGNDWTYIGLLTCYW